MHTIPIHEIQQLKTLLEHGSESDYQVQEKLSDIINNAIEDAFRPDICKGNLPPLVACEGLEISQNVNSWETPGIGLDPEFMESIDNMSKTILHLQHKVSFLEDMHSSTEDGGNVATHVPEIISTREQYEEMKPRMEKEDRVIIHTTFDKALKVL